MFCKNTISALLGLLNNYTIAALVLIHAILPTLILMLWDIIYMY